jgi:hypothetical protein
MGALQAGLETPQSPSENNALHGSSVLDQLFAEDFLQQLAHRAEELAPQYQANKPFPHIYFDNFLPPAIADLALATFPDPDKIDWLRHRGIAASISIESSLSIKPRSCPRPCATFSSF